MVCTVLGCGGKKTETTSTPGPRTEGETPRATASQAVAPSRGVHISKFRLGYGFGPEGTVYVDGGTFAQGESAFVSFDLNNAPAGAKARIAWNLQPTNRTLAQSEAPVSSDKPTVAIKADTATWPLGEYVLQIFLVPSGADPVSVGTAKLKIVKDRPK